MPENIEAMPEISASPAPQDAKPADTGEKKQKKPRNTSGMKPPLNQLPPEEAFAIRSKGGKAAAKKRREEKLVKDALLNLLTKPQHKKKGGKAHYKASAELTSYDDVFSENTTLMVQMLIPLIQSAINGNIESLFAILRVLGQEPGTPGQFGVDEFTPPEPPTEGAGGPGKTEPASDPNAVRIHLIRGEKPAPVAEGDVSAVEQADADQAGTATPVTTPADGEAVPDA